MIEEEERMAAIITNFQAPKKLDDLIDRYYRDGETNIDKILFDPKCMHTEWTVDRYNQIGDRVFFMCAKTSKDHMKRVLMQARSTEDQEIIEFAEKEMDLYQHFAGNIVAMGIIAELPFASEDSGYNNPGWKSPWYARIDDYCLLNRPVSIDVFRDFIKVSRTGAITKLTSEQEERLLELIAM